MWFIDYVAKLVDEYLRELTEGKLKLKDLDIDLIFLKSQIEYFGIDYKKYLIELNNFIISQYYKHYPDEYKSDYIDVLYIDHMIETENNMFFELIVGLKNFIQIYDSSFNNRKFITDTLNSDSNLSQSNFKYWKLLFVQYYQNISTIQNYLKKYLITDLVQLINIQQI